MRIWYLVSVWMHLAAAAAWIGSMVFLGLVLVPVLRDAAFDTVRTRLLYRTGLRLRWVGWIMLGLLVATGILNLGFRGYTWHSLWTGALWRSAWGHLLALKVTLVIVLLLVSAVHDFYLGPRAARLLEQHPGQPGARRIRRAASWMGRITLLLSLAVLALAVVLVRGAR